MEIGFLALTGVIIGAVVSVARRLWHDHNYKKLPTFSEYREKLPRCVGPDGKIKCYNCSSTSFRNLGLEDAGDGYRIHVCNGCGTTLFRSSV